METRDPTRSARNEKVLNCLYQKPDAVFKLICFPWAGGGSIHFAKWGQTTNGLLEVHSVRLAGRETRFQEPFADDIYQIADEIASALLPVIQDQSFAFFGHSFGSYVAFMTALNLKEKHKLEPLHLFLSSAPSPYSESLPSIPELNKLSEEEIRHYLLQFGGTPKYIMDNKEVLEQSIPVMKADITIFQKFSFDKPSKSLLSSDITCFLGSEDMVKDIEGWKDITRGNLDVYKLPGDHFYLLEPSNEDFIKNYITKCLELTSIANF